MSQKPFAPSTERNSLPILEVIRREFVHASTVLEIGSGTGQHAVCFGNALHHLRWQTSELIENHAAIHAWLDEAGLPNVSKPIELDVLTADVLPQDYDAVFSANELRSCFFPSQHRSTSIPESRTEPVSESSESTQTVISIHRWDSVQ